MKGGSADFCTAIVKTVQYAAAGKDFPMKGFDNHKRVTLSARSASEQTKVRGKGGSQLVYLVIEGGICPKLEYSTKVFSS